MSSSEKLLILGASARSAAMSALRAGLEPWCADLFADADLQARCPVVCLAADRYPDGFLDLANSGPPGPWIYTGALENSPRLVRAISNHRPLWGNDEESLLLCRAPGKVASILADANVPCPPVRLSGPVPTSGRWLSKPLHGAGGRGIRFRTAASRADQSPRVYFQRFIPGKACSAVYVAAGNRTQLLGVTRQLIGRRWLHSAGFQYGGSIGPLKLTAQQSQAFLRLGEALATGCRLRGLFGVDCVLQDSVPWPIEVNPRYTASVEVLEYATHVPALALHRCVFEAGSLEPQLQPGPAPRVIGKAILFARERLTFPEHGPWLEELRQPRDVWELPAFADIPNAGQTIEARQPILSFFASEESVHQCRRKLEQQADELDRALFEG